MRYDYDVVVLGGGAAGLVAATGLASLGAKTALIENKKLGGDCTWYGCIPSKALLKSAQVFSLLKKAGDFGIKVKDDLSFSPANAMAHVRDMASKISTHHPPEMFEKRGIKVLFGNAKFTDNRRIDFEGRQISSKRFIICTGSHPLLPPIEGLKGIKYLTNENIFDLEVLPKSVAVLGGGPIGVEISQAFARLGVDISIVEMADRLLFREDIEASKALTDVFANEGIKIYTGQKAVRFSRQGEAVNIALEDKSGKQSVISAEKVLVAVGRQANVQGLDLEKAGVKYSPKGIETDNTLRTSAKNIYACGDVVGPYQFSHMAEYQAVIAVGNALSPFKRKVNYNAVPWCAFTDPEVAHLGLTEEEAGKQYKDIKVYKAHYAQNDRAVTDLEEGGFAKAICDKKGHILGAHIVGAAAGEIIHEYVLAKSSGLKITDLSSGIHIYPTLSQIVKRSADAYYLDKLSSPWVKRLSRFFINRLK